MTGYPYRIQFVWLAALALLWLGASSPWSSAWNASLAISIALVTCLALIVATRHLRARRAASRHVLWAIDGALRSLPGDTQRYTPLVLGVGETQETLARAFGSDFVHISDAAIWVRVNEPAHLKHVAAALKQWRDGQGPDAVALLVDADSTADNAAFTATIRQWHTAIDEASRAVGYSLPTCVAVYVTQTDAMQQPCPWFGMSGQLLTEPHTLVDHVVGSAFTHARWVPKSDRADWTRRSVWVDAAARWALDHVLPTLTAVAGGARSANLTAFGVTVVQGQPTPASMMARYVETITGVARPEPSGVQAHLPLPGALLQGIALQPIRRPLPRALAHAFAGLAVAFCAAAIASAWQNRALVARLQVDMARYQAIPRENDVARLDALATIKHDRNELERYARMGVPPRLGLGFYRAGSLLPSTNALIAGYQPPPPAPSMIELDALSLFKSGSAVLNPGSNRVMFGALEMIKAHPNKRVLVAGHTDSVGNPVRNMTLSEARATSVRDWLADASGIPLSQFAIQGYGDTRPKASNDTNAGRAANRRVEITLIPDCRSGSTAGRSTHSPQGQSACSFE